MAFVGMNLPFRFVVPDQGKTNTITSSRRTLFLAHFKPLLLALLVNDISLCSFSLPES